MARPKYEPTEEQRRQVRMLAAFGNTQEQIASVLEISDRTLRKHLRKELDRGVTEANSQIAQALFKKAKEGDTAAQIFWLKTRAGWRERKGFDGPALAAAPFVVAREKDRA